MFTVDSKFQYILHYVSSEEIANAVKDDLASREECVHPETVTITDHDNKHAGWDPGGVLMMNDKTFIFELDNITISIYHQHFNHFVNWVYNAVQREWFDVKYYKIHSGYLSCLCISDDELKQLKTKLSNPALALEANKSEQKRQMAVEEVFTQATVSKDNGGNIMVVKRKKPVLN